MKKFKLPGTGKQRDVEFVVENPRDGTGLLKVLRVIVYGALILILGVGALNLVRNDRAELDQLKAEIEMKLYGEKPVFDKEAARGFAERFTRVYLEFSADQGTEKRERLGAMVEGGVSALGIKRVDSKAGITVKDVYTWDVESVTENQINVITGADIEVAVTETQADGSTSTKVTYDDVYMKIPLYYDEGDFIVDGIPVFVARPEMGDIKENPIVSLPETDRRVREEIHETLGAFFRAYYSGTPLEISYYLANKEQIPGLAGDFQVNQLSSVQTYWVDEAAATALALVKLTVRDDITGAEYGQWYHVEVKKTEDRWYVTQFDARITNLKKYIKEEK